MSSAPSLPGNAFGFREVEVFYDPANPSNAALEKPDGVAWYLLGVAGVCFAIVLYASGLLG